MRGSVTSADQWTGELAPIGGVWETNVGPVQVPTDSHPNCRCAMGLVFPDWDKVPGLEKIFKFNPYHDQEGRFTTAGAAFTISAMPTSMRGTTGHVAALASAQGGFTYNQKRGEFRRSGFAVSPFKAHEATFGLDEWARSGPELVKKYMADKSDVLGQPNAHVGGWKGEDEQGRVRIYLDVSVVRNDSKSAANLARRHDQIAYFDLSTLSEIRRKKDGLYYGDDGIGKASTRQGGVYFIAPRDARDPAALLTFVNTISDSQPVLMGSALSKFNPYHDAAGRFTSANAAATISGGALGANREVTISLAEAALGSLTDSQKTLLREAAAGKIDFFGSRSAQSNVWENAIGGVSVAVTDADRGKLKEQGTQDIANEMTAVEQAMCGRAMRLQGFDDAPEFLAKDFVAEQHNGWAKTAGGNPAALAVQLAAAEMQGWDDQQIADRVFRETSRADVAAARDLASRAIAQADRRGVEGAADTGIAESYYITHLLRGDNAIDRINEIGQAEGIGTIESYGREGLYVKSHVIVAAQAFIRSELLGDAHKAVLAANQRVSQKILKQAVGESPTITLFRGVQVGMLQPESYQPREATFPTGGTIRSQSSPLSSWSVSRPEAVAFAGGFDEGVLLRADVPISSIVGLSSTGFGCIVEGEAIVSGASFTATVAERNPPPVIEMKVGKPVPAGAVAEPWSSADYEAGYKLEKAIPTINLDSTDINQDWPKRTPDTYAALGLPSPISKFNPNHDELGRFSSGPGEGTTGTGLPLHQRENSPEVDAILDKMGGDDGLDASLLSDLSVAEDAARWGHIFRNEGTQELAEALIDPDGSYSEALQQNLDRIFGPGETITLYRGRLPGGEDKDKYVSTSVSPRWAAAFGRGGFALLTPHSRAGELVEMTVPKRNVAFHGSPEEGELVIRNDQNVIERVVESLPPVGRSVSKFNPHHDELGRFTSAGGGATTYTGGRGRHEGAIEVVDAHPNPRLVSQLPKETPANKTNVGWTEAEVDAAIAQGEKVAAAAEAYAKEIAEVRLELGSGVVVDAELSERSVVVGVGGVITIMGDIRYGTDHTDPENRSHGGEFTIKVDPDGMRLNLQERVSREDTLGFAEGKPHAEVKGLYLDPDITGEGVGTALMAHWEDQLARSGIERLVVHAASRPGVMQGGYVWLKYGYIPARGQVNDMILGMTSETTLSSTSVGRLLNLRGASHDYEVEHGQDVVPLFEQIPEFKEYTLDNANWWGSKNLETIEKAETPPLPAQMQATIRTANQWMRERPADLERDDDAFWAEVAEARGSAPIKKFNPYHDAGGKFTTAQGNVTGAAKGRLTRATKNLKKTRRDLAKAEKALANPSVILRGKKHAAFVKQFLKNGVAAVPGTLDLEPVKDIPEIAKAIKIKGGHGNHSVPRGVQRSSSETPCTTTPP